MRQNYIWDSTKGKFVEAEKFARPVHGKRADLPAPMVMHDIEPYTSPIDGKVIGSRSSRREDLKANNCVEWDSGIGTKFKRTPGEYKNPKFAAKRGLPLNEEAKAKLEAKAKQ